VGRLAEVGEERGEPGDHGLVAPREDGQHVVTGIGVRGPNDLVQSERKREGEGEKIMHQEAEAAAAAANRAGRRSYGQ
jgi:hypothetical protein